MLMGKLSYLAGRTRSFTYTSNSLQLLFFARKKGSTRASKLDLIGQTIFGLQQNPPLLAIPGRCFCNKFSQDLLLNTLFSIVLQGDLETWTHPLIP